MAHPDHDLIIKIGSDVGYIRKKIEEQTVLIGANALDIDGLRSSRDKVLGGFAVLTFAIGAIIAKIANIF